MQPATPTGEMRNSRSGRSTGTGAGAGCGSCVSPTGIRHKRIEDRRQAEQREAFRPRGREQQLADHQAARN